jgi:hypothetical protein
MRQNRERGVLARAYDDRVMAIERLQALAEGKPEIENIRSAAEKLRRTGQELGNGPVGRSYAVFASLMDIVYFLSSWARAVRSAELDADRHLRAAKQWSRDLAKEIQAPPRPKFAPEILDRVQKIQSPDETEGVIKTLLCQPLPLPLFREERSDGYIWPRRETTKPDEDFAMAWILFSFEGKSFGKPQTIRPQALHDLEITIRLDLWPEDADQMIVEFTSVEPSSTYDMPIYQFHRPEDSAPHKFHQTGRLIIRLPQTIHSRPLEFACRARFLPDSCETRIAVAGHKYLAIQGFDPRLDPISGYQAVDERLLEIRDQLRGFPGIGDEEIGYFLTIMTALGRVAGQALQDSLYSQRWDEEMFQKDIRCRLQNDPTIGSDLEEHPHAAGGITDLSFRRIRIELKVVNKGPVSLEGADKFSDQIAQYVAGSDRRLGVLCVLDSSEKDGAPGSVTNDIGLQELRPTASPHATPLILGIVVIRGNLKRPSDLTK